MLTNGPVETPVSAGPSASRYAGHPGWQAGPMPLRARAHWFGITLDAPDARELAHFYQRLLDWQIHDESDDWVTLAPAANAGYNLAFATHKLYERPVWPAEPGEPQMSMHLDIEVDDLDEAVGHALRAGAEIASYQPQHTVRVMLDPAGHPFCLYLGGHG
jgi:predicted enzyme related to lactoylglutathione lyase